MTYPQSTDIAQLTALATQEDIRREGMISQTGLYEGDRIRLNYQREGNVDFTVERFRDCLGIFESDQHREAQDFTPLCNLYGRGAGSEDGYISNFGEYVKNPVPVWMQLPRTTKGSPQ